MQVPPVLPPVLTGSLPQDAVTKMLPQVQAQASAPVIQRAVDPSTRPDRGNKSRSSADKGKSGGDKGRGGSVNIRV